MDMDIPGEKPKEQNMLAALNKEKLTSKFMAFKGQSNLDDMNSSIRFSYAFLLDKPSNLQVK